MTIKDSNLAANVIKSTGADIGQLYFFNHLVVSEFKEGVHVTIESAQEVIKIIRDYFGVSRPFGFISNMVNSYSMNPTDSPKFKEELKNLRAYGVVSYTNAGHLNAAIENNFCKNENIRFDDLYVATDTVYNKINDLKSPSISQVME